MELVATHKGHIDIGSVSLECAVLNNGKRVFSERAVSKILGSRGGRHWVRKKQNDTDGMPAYLSAKNLQGFISPELREKIQNYIPYKAGNKIGFGIDATVLPQICEVFLKARDAKAILPSQEHIVEQADILIRSFAKVGIVALIDEATGYQKDRDRNELEKLLSRYLTEERLKWAKRFPDNFYKEIYRLNRWEWPPKNTSKRPGIIGKYTNEVVYERLPQGVLEKLREINPVITETKRRKYKHHQFLSEDVGQPDLHSHLLQVIALMKASNSWAEFMKLLNRAFPIKNQRLQELPGISESN